MIFKLPLTFLKGLAEKTASTLSEHRLTNAMLKAECTTDPEKRRIASLKLNDLLSRDQRAYDHYLNYCKLEIRLKDLATMAHKPAAIQHGPA